MESHTESSASPEIYGHSSGKKRKVGLMADFISLHVHKRKNIYSLKFSFSRPEVAPFIFTISFT